MASPIEGEPKPRLPPLPFEPFPLPGAEIVLPVPDPAPAVNFSDVLDRRQSRSGGKLGLERLSALLWHSARVRDRHRGGRFGLSWDHRAAPSAGGLHVIQLLCLPLDEDGLAGFYDPLGHSLRSVDVAVAAKARNREIVGDLTGASGGTALWFAADITKAEACYENSCSLILRDAGALLATIALCAAWLDISACPLGSLGREFPVDFGLPSARFTGVGGILVGSIALADHLGPASYLAIGNALCP